MINKKILRVLLLHTLILSMLVLFVIFIPCPLFALTDITCPLCGITRATLAFLQGDFSMAISLHPLFMVFPFALLFFCHVRIISKKIGKRAAAIISVTIILIFLIAYFVRDKSILYTAEQPFFR